MPDAASLADAFDTVLTLAKPYKPLPLQPDGWPDVLNSKAWKAVEAAWSHASRLAVRCGLEQEVPSTHTGATLLHVLRAEPPAGVERLRLLRDALRILATGRPPSTLRELQTCMAAWRSNGLVCEQILRSVPERSGLERAFRRLFPQSSFHGAEAAEYLAGWLAEHERATDVDVWKLPLSEAVEMLKPPAIPPPPPHVTEIDRREDRVILVRMAQAELLIEGPNASKIAGKIGVPRTTLLGWPEFREYYERAKERLRADMDARRKRLRRGDEDSDDEDRDDKE
jgi:hypothetical protein